jgi:hypothetical protein
MCQEQGKTWEGAAPTCYFDNPQGNWNCATVNAVRDILTPDGFWVDKDKLPKGVCVVFGDDMTYGLVCLQDIDMPDDLSPCECLYIQWYKRRGATEALWIVGEDEGNSQPRRPTENELLAIIDHYKKLLKGK